MKKYPLIVLLLSLSFGVLLNAQDSTQLTIDRIFSGEFSTGYFGPSKWLEGGTYYTTLERSKSVDGRDIVKYNSKTGDRTILVSAEKLIPENAEKPLSIADYSWSNDLKKLLIFTNTSRVWRTNTKGDYWVFDLKSNELMQLGKDLTSSSLMFTKFSNDDKQVAFVSEYNLYVQDLKSEKVRQLTKDGNGDIINGTFDWAYEEEFSCKDGFRWNADGKYLAYWQVDASDIKDFFMINNTDEVYSKLVPIQYPKVGEKPSAVKVGVVNVTTGKTIWFDIPSDPLQDYLPRMQWVNADQVLVQQLNRKQNTRKLWLCSASSGKIENIHIETEETWIDITQADPTVNWEMTDFSLLENGKAFVWQSEKDNWRHLYKVDIEGKKETLLTKGEYDIARLYQVDEKGGFLFVNMSPDNPTQRYLYTVQLDGSGKKKRLTPEDQNGVHNYNISPDGKFAIHNWSNHNTPPSTTLISLPDHKIIRTLVDNKKYIEKFNALNLPRVETFKVTTEDGIEVDGWMMKPSDFDQNKKYPVLFYVYGEPWGQTTTDSWGTLWHRMMSQKGYVVISLDNRGTPALKGKEWRKSIYRKIGVVNSRDQAMAAKVVIGWDFIDADRTAVWGWSGGGSMTLNLLFRYPEIYKTGVSVAPVGNQLLYDNIYQERYMGLPQENREDFVEGSPVTYAKNLEGNLLLIHGTGDDNVHYQNSEVIINELIKQDKQFQMMAYPNRSHGIYEGQNTTRHLYKLISGYIFRNTPPDVESTNVIRP
jgi:dipeptidyl-peptidase 4